MTRLGVVFWGGLVLASGFATFNVKYAVQGIDEELARVRRQTVAEQQEIRVLTAEWAYLNQPDRLAELNRSFLQLAPMTTPQLQGRVDEIALRPPPAMGDVIAPPPMLAANPRETAPSAANPSVANSSAAKLAPVPEGAARAGVTAIGGIRTAEPPADTAQTADSRDASAKGAETPLAEAASGGTRIINSVSDAAAALAEALRLLGIDAGGADAGRQTATAQPAKAVPAITTQAVATQVAKADSANSARTAVPVADAHGAETRSGKPQTADAVAGAARDVDNISNAASLTEALHLLGADSGGVKTGGADAGGQTPRVRLAKASPATLDALISKITDPR